jgi:hypothetical protein
MEAITSRVPPRMWAWAGRSFDWIHHAADRALQGAPRHLPEILRGMALGISAGAHVFATQATSGELQS